MLFGFELLLVIDRNGRCFDRLDVAEIAVAIPATAEACDGAVMAGPNVTALLARDTMLLALVAGDKAASRKLMSDEAVTASPAIIGIAAFEFEFACAEDDIDCCRSGGFVIFVG